MNKFFAIVLCCVMVVLSACSKQTPSNALKTSESDDTEHVSELINTEDCIKIKQENTKLLVEINKLKADVQRNKENDTTYSESGESDLYAIQDSVRKGLEKKYPEIMVLNTLSGSIESINVSLLADMDEKLSIDEPILLNLIVTSFRVSQVSNNQIIIPDESGQYRYKINKENSNVEFNVLSENIISFDKYPDVYFITDKKIAFLGLGFLKNCSSFPQQNLVTKMEKIKLMQDKISGAWYWNERPYYFLNSLFSQLGKEVDTKQINERLTLHAQYVFWYFGEQISCSFFDGFVVISDSHEERGYLISNEGRISVLSTISAG